MAHKNEKSLKTEKPHCKPNGLTMRFNVELVTGLEPATCSLRMRTQKPYKWLCYAEYKISDTPI
jgi:hypothetical protein